MKFKSVVLTGALAAGGYTLIQAQPPGALRVVPEPADRPWLQKEPSRPACLEEALRLCSSKEIQEEAQCVKRKSRKCKEGHPK